MSKENNRERLLSVDYLKAIAIIFVVLGHSLTYYAENYGKLSLVSGLTSLLICSVHVPLFFIVAGFLCHKQDVKKYIYSKCKRILAPFVTFSILKIFYSAFIDNNSAHGETIIDQVVDAFLLGRLYWFAYCIFGIYLIAIWFWKKECESTESNNKRILISVLILLVINILFACMGRTYIFNHNIFQINYIIRYLPYFLIGYFIKENRNSFKLIEKNNVVLVLAMTLVLVITILISSQLIPNIYPATFAMAISLSYIIYKCVKMVTTEIKALTVIGRFSLQIMFFDSLLKVILFVLASRMFGVSTGTAFMIAAVDVVVGAVLSFIIEKVPYINCLFGL